VLLDIAAEDSRCYLMLFDKTTGGSNWQHATAAAQLPATCIAYVTAELA
jgi:hypothetical protein